MVLAGEDGIEVVAEAGDGEEAVVQAEATMPDVVLMDVRMPKRSGIEATRAIKELLPSARILMLTVSDEEEDLYEAVKAGAAGYLLKESSIEEVATAIRSVVAGQSMLSPSVAAKLLAEFGNLARQAAEQRKGIAPRLTERELDVLRLVAHGYSNREVANRLFISENTVRNHMRNILEKLHLRSRMEAVLYAVRQNLVELPD
jgi:two-component system NarL family response regulator